MFEMIKKINTKNYVDHNQYWKKDDNLCYRGLKTNYGWGWISLLTVVYSSAGSKCIRKMIVKAAPVMIADEKEVLE